MKPCPLILIIICALLPKLLSADEITLVKHAHKQEALPTENTGYVVKPDDTLADIFIKEFGARPGELPYLYKKFRELNPGVTNLNYIKINQKLVIPRIQRSRPQTQKGYEVQAVEKDAYVIQQGEHLAQILRKVYGLSDEQIFREYIAAIKELNPQIKDPNMIHPGQKILIPPPKEGALRKDQQQQQPPSSSDDERQGPPPAQAVSPAPVQGLSATGKAAPPPAAVKAPAAQLPPVAVLPKIQTTADMNTHVQSQRAAKPADLPQPKPTTPPQPKPIPLARPVAQAPAPTPPAAIKPQATAPIALKENKQSPVTSKEPLIPPIAVKKPEPAKSAVNENVARLIRNTLFPAFKQMGASQRDQGTYFMPIPGGGNIAIDAQEIPVMELETGNKIILDINGKISPEMRTIIEKAFPSCKVITNPGPDLESIMDRVLSVSGYFSINKHASPLLVGGDEKVKLSGTWIVYKDYSRSNVFVINILKADERKTPRPIRDYAARFGLDIIELGGNEALPSKATGLSPRDLQHSYTALLDQLGVAYTQDQVIVIASLDKTLSITYKAPLLAGKIIIAPELPDPTLLGLLKQKGYTVVNAKEAVIKDVLDGLSIAVEGPPVKLVIAQGRTEIDVPGIRIGKTIILESMIDRDIARYLEGLGWELMVW
ncbi:MAG: LysM peptidoglycan-binding domain-containing protein [Syntrophaceae bacterium]